MENERSQDRVRSGPSCGLNYQPRFVGAPGGAEWLPAWRRYSARGFYSRIVIERRARTSRAEMAARVGKCVGEWSSSGYGLDLVFRNAHVPSRNPAV